MAELASITSLLKPLEFAESFTEQELSVLASKARLVQYKDQDRVIDFGETSFDLVLVADGAVEIRTAMNDMLDRLGAGCLIGELSFIDGKARSARVVAAGECQAIVFPAALLTELSEPHPHIVVKVLHYIALVLCRKLRSTTRLMEASFV